MEGSEEAILDDLVESCVIMQVDEIVLEHHPRRAADLASLLGTLADSGFEYRIAVSGDRFWEPDQLLVVHAFRGTAIS